MLKVAMVTGSLPPDACGIGDYSQLLARSLGEFGVDVTCFGGGSWPRFLGRNGILSALRTGGFDLIHLQYPAMRFGRSPMPALLPVFSGSIPFAVTLHEFSSFKKIRRPWFLSFAHLADVRIFTSDRERVAFEQCMRPTKGRDVVIPIGSNIGRGAPKPRRKNSVCTFGLICPGKGLETFLDFAELCRAKNDWPISLIGARPASYGSYADDIIARAKRIGIDLYLNLPEPDVADLLAEHEIAYLPFPDGATATRGSLLAALNNGAVVFTRHADRTPTTLRQTTISVDTPTQAFERMTMLFADAKEIAERRAALFSVADEEWRAIAAAHLPPLLAAVEHRVPATRRFAIRTQEESSRCR